jgi:hypothetical protein
MLIGACCRQLLEDFAQIINAASASIAIISPGPTPNPLKIFDAS